MGSCAARRINITSQKSMVDAQTNTVRKKERPMILKLRKEVEARRIIFQKKDFNAPTLNISESNLFARRQCSSLSSINIQSRIKL